MNEVKAACKLLSRQYQVSENVVLQLIDNAEWKDMKIHTHAEVINAITFKKDEIAGESTLSSFDASVRALSSLYADEDLMNLIKPVRIKKKDKKEE